MEAASGRHVLLEAIHVHDVATLRDVYRAGAFVQIDQAHWAVPLCCLASRQVGRQVGRKAGRQAGR